MSAEVSRPVGLTGFMGVGKSTVGRRLAERLGRPFVDVDARLEEELGKPIPRVFAEEGEAAFREAEARVCRSILDEHPLGGAPDRPGPVVALGGGALIDPVTRRRWLEEASVVCLTARRSTLLDRLQAESASRPMLSGASQSAASSPPGRVDDERAALCRRLDELLLLRRRVYAAAPIQVATDAKSPEDVAALVEERVRAEARLWGRAGDTPRLVVDTEQGAYPVWVGAGLTREVGAQLAALGLAPGPVLAGYQAPVAEWMDRAERSLVEAGQKVARCELPPGEEHKDLGSLDALWTAAAEAGLTRDRFLVAVGGGTVGDVVGLAAATWMRGVPFVQVPTTLLAMVDASVGGKTAVDRPEGKNLVGAFHQPAAVLVDPETLSTLPEAEVTAGLAEVLKHALLDERGTDESFLQMLERSPRPDPTDLSPALLRRAIAVKARIVEEDTTEKGRRAFLNLGHTFGHALERNADYRLRHGDAVAVGMCAAAHLAQALGRAPASLTRRIEAAARHLGLPTTLRELLGPVGLSPDEGGPFSPAALTAAMAGDKKATTAGLRLVILEELGRPALVPAPEPAVLERAWKAVTDGEEHP